MATGASTADLAVILVDARKGILTQTKRHSYICSLLGIRSVVLAVNKMDLVDFSGELFYRIVSDYVGFAKTLGFSTICPIPLSARHGDNVTTPSARTPWYDGPALLQHLEAADVTEDLTAKPFRFPVQWVNRPDLDFRGLAGTVASGRGCRWVTRWWSPQRASRRPSPGSLHLTATATMRCRAMPLR
jgi:bifunctional enzyme CysN/CysC